MLTFISYVQTFLTRIAPKRENDDRGATAVEYGLMVSLIAIAIIVAVTAVGVNLDALFDFIAAELAP
jgi:pilus assembly protein Flp/PilA